MTYTVPPGRYSDVNSAFVQAYIDAAIAGVVELAPETLNSLNELAAAINDDPAFYATVASQVSELNTDVTDLVAALGVAENDSEMGTFTATTLPDGVTLKAVLEAFASAYETTKSNLEGADTALSGRVDALEADPTTATAVSQVQADVDQNELDSDAADLALSNRLDTLETDPVTLTYVDDQISSDMWLFADQAAFPSAADNHGRVVHSHADGANFYAHGGAWIELGKASADDALSGRLDTLEADPVTQSYVDSADGTLSGRLDTLESDPTTQTAVDAKLNTADPAATGKLTVDSDASLEFDSNLTKLHNELRGTSIVIGNNITLNPAAADGRVEVEGEFYLRPSDLTDAADDTAAAAAGVIVGQVYHNSGALRVRLS